jgi:membrane-associated phospholipid phosphatase
MIRISSPDKKIENNILKHDSTFYTKADQYLKWAPFTSLLFIHLTNLKTKNRLKDSLIISGLSIGIVNSIVYPLKKITREERPYISVNKHSFPSGHTATCFAGAELLREELKESYPVFSFIGYAMAVTTGILRLLNKKHWASDVIAGAAIGVLSARLSLFVNKKIIQNTEEKERNLQLKTLYQENNATYQAV